MEPVTIAFHADRQVRRHVEHLPRLQPRIQGVTAGLTQDSARHESSALPAARATIVRVCGEPDLAG